MDVIRVVDVPVGTCADEAQRILNGPCAENRYLLVQVLQLPDGSLRAIYRLLARALDPERVAMGRPAFEGNRDGLEAEAVTMIQDRPHASLREIVKDLADAGIIRGKDWVREKRRSIAAV